MLAPTNTDPPLTLSSHHSFNSYADDTQLYIAVSSDDLESIDSLFNCIIDLKSCIEENFLELNRDKTGFSYWF